MKKVDPKVLVVDKSRSFSSRFLQTEKNVDMGSTENKVSSTLRHSSNVLQSAAADLVVSDITSVEQALRTKLRQTEQMKAGQ